MNWIMSEVIAREKEDAPFFYLYHLMGNKYVSFGKSAYMLQLLFPFVHSYKIECRASVCLAVSETTLNEDLFTLMEEEKMVRIHSSKKATMEMIEHWKTGLELREKESLDISFLEKIRTI